MRFVVAALTSIVLVLPTLAWSKGKPEPITCPADVAVAIAEACPCDGKLLPNGGVQPWKNHGQFVSCTVRFRNDLRKAGCLSADQKRTIARCAAKSSCGKTDTALCCTANVGTCMGDPMPGDTLAGGTCSNDALAVCDVDIDCTKLTGTLTKDPAGCAAAGGTVGAGSVCSGCVLP